MTALVAAVNALGSGWSANALESNLGLYDAMEILPVASGLRCLNEFAYAQVPYYPEMSFEIDHESAMIYMGTGFGRGRFNITVRYTAGYTTTPADLEQACIDLVLSYYRGRKRDLSVSKEKLSDHMIEFYGSSNQASDVIPDVIQQRLQAYVRVAI